MMLPCEVAVKSVLPTIRGEIVKILYYEFRLKQVDIAKLLGISQPAVSHYIRGLRGGMIKLDGHEDIKNEIRKFTKALVENKLSYEEKLLHFCKICSMIRCKGLLCEIHKKFDEEAAKVECDFCLGKKHYTDILAGAKGIKASPC